jgi:hypothetical protein
MFKVLSMEQDFEDTGIENAFSLIAAVRNAIPTGALCFVSLKQRMKKLKVCLNLFGF